MTQEAGRKSGLLFASGPGRGLQPGQRLRTVLRCHRPGTSCDADGDSAESIMMDRFPALRLLCALLLASAASSGAESQATGVPEIRIRQRTPDASNHPGFTRMPPPGPVSNLSISLRAMGS